MENVKEITRNDILYSKVRCEKPAEDKVPLIGIRHSQIFLYFILMSLGFGSRTVLSVCIISMTDPKASVNPNIPTYKWTDKSVILSAFFWGYIIPQIFAGYAANKFGAKWFLIATTMTQSLLSILVPFTAAQFGSNGLCISRALQGFCQGFLFPSVAHLLSQWVPREEISRLGAFTYGAGPFGTLIGMLIAGLISASWYGWPMVFYIYGGLGVIWCIIFTIFGYNSPAVHPTIGRAEKYYIEKSLGHTDEIPAQNVPWKSIFTSVPLWALFIILCGNNYSFWTLLTQAPTYMNYVMHFNIQSNGILSALPYLIFWFLNFIFSFISDFIINKKLVSISVSRKIFNFIGLVFPAIALILLGFTRADQTTQAVVLLVAAVSINAAALCGWGINHMDLSPNHAGTIMGITNSFSNIPAILAPLIVQVVVTTETDPLEWRIIFLIGAGLNIIVTIIYIIFGSGEVQPWNNDLREESRVKLKEFNS